jgi:hypothetical protein
MESKFLVDLSVLNLTKEQTANMEKAINKAVAAEIATLNIKGKISFVPLEKSKSSIKENSNRGSGSLDLGNILSGIKARKDELPHI